MASAETVSVLVAFSAGLLSVFSPCVLALLPAYIIYLSGVSLSDNATARQRYVSGLHALVFCAGFAGVFIGFGASATLVGQLLLAHQALVRKVAGVLVAVFGLHALGFIRIPWPAGYHKPISGRPSYMRSLLIGAAFAAGWSPCVGPILGSILLYAGAQAQLGQGVFLLAVYSVGMAAPFIALGFGLGRVAEYLVKLRPYSRLASLASGVFLLLSGLCLYTDSFRRLSIGINW